MKAPKKVSTALRRAAAILRRRGWIGGAGNCRGPVCIAQAVGLATGNGDGVNLCLNDKAIEVLAALGFSDRYAAWGWNDRKGRRSAHVLRRVDRAAKLAAKAEAKR